MTNETTHYQINLEGDIVVTSRFTLHNLFQEKHGADAVSLYMFYYYTAKWQKTNQPKATIQYCMKGLGWGEDRVRRAKAILLKYDLVEDIKQIDKQTRKITGWYMKLSYLWKNSTIPKNPEGGLSHRVSDKGTNALSVDNINALSVDNKKTTSKKTNKEEDNIEEAKQFIREWNKIYDSPIRSYRSWINNLKFWRQDYSLEEIVEAMKKGKHHHFYKDKLTPDMLLRTNDDRIGMLLNYKSPQKPEMKEVSPGILRASDGSEYVDFDRLKEAY